MLHRFIIVLLLLLVLPDFFIYKAYIRKRTSRLLLRCLYWLPTCFFLLGILFFYYWGNSAMGERFPQAVGWFSIFCFLFIVPKLLITLFGGLGTIVRCCFHRCRRAPFTLAGIVAGGLMALVILYGSFVGRTQFNVKEVTYCSDRLPHSFDGYRIVQLSDIHIGSWRGNTAAIRRMVKMVNDLHPDLIVFTGDFGEQSCSGVRGIHGNTLFSSGKRWHLFNIG